MLIAIHKEFMKRGHCCQVFCLFCALVRLSTGSYRSQLIIHSLCIITYKVAFIMSDIYLND